VTVTRSRFTLRPLPILLAAAALAAGLILAQPASPPDATSFEVAGVTGPRIAAAGDIACDPQADAFEGGRGRGLECRQLATSRLIVDGPYEAVLVLGDVQYEEATTAQFEASYDRSWGRFLDITRPVPGNHEYRTDGASGYFGYFGAAAGDSDKGYYGFRVGAWHLVALNSDCEQVEGCHAGSAQERWLRAELAANSTRCTLAYWHHPRYSSGRDGSYEAYAPFWQALHEADADVVLAGHAHGYERFAPQDARGGRDRERGIRQFVVGTGGKSLRPHTSFAPNSEARDASSLGVLELTLGDDAYAWRFRAAVGDFTDAGSASCH
jgi:hypothetical protein